MTEGVLRTAPLPQRALPRHKKSAAQAGPLCGGCCVDPEACRAAHTAAGRVQPLTTRSTALTSASVSVHSLEAMTMTTQPSRPQMMAFSTLLCACANSA